MEPIIQIRNLTYFYRRQQNRPALNDVSFEIRTGEFVAIAGRAGSGKSTLCYALNGLIPHSFGGTIRGQVIVCGLDTKTVFVPELARRVGFVSQNAESQLVGLTVEEDACFGLENIGLPRSEIAQRVSRALSTVQLEDLSARSPWTLSGGQKQRLAIAAAMAFQPDLLVLDNPTAELDPIGKREVIATLGSLNAEAGITMVVVDQELEEVLPYASRLVLMDSGRIVSNGAPEDVIDAADEIERVGVRLPDIVQVARSLREKRYWIGRLPVRMEDAVTAMRELTPQGVASNAPVAAKKVDREILIGFHNVSFSYPNGNSVLRDVNLQIRKGEFVTLMGPNGAGKTTVAKHMNGLLTPSSGIVRVRGTDTREASVAELAKTVGYVFQNPDHQLFSRTVAEELAFGPRNLHWQKARIDEAVHRALEKIGGHERGHDDPFFMGLAERKLVAIASVLIMEPEVLVLDEPATGADHEAALRIMNYLSDLHRQGLTVVIVTHDVSIAADYADRIVVVNEGEIVLDGSPTVVFQDEKLQSCMVNPPQVMQLARELNFPDTICRVHEMVRYLAEN